MCRVILFLVISACSAGSFAFDEHFSLITSADVEQFSQPFYSAELATMAGQRLVYSGQVDWSVAKVGSNHQFSVNAGTRLLYSTNIDAQWYPMAGVRYQLNSNQIDAWLGVGIQREVFSELSGVASAQWYPDDNAISVSLGLRLWLTRFQSLDARMRRASPAGAVYRSTANAHQAEAILVQPTKPIKPDPIVPVAAQTSSNRVAPKVAEPSMSSATAVKTTTNSELKTNGNWYVHLGIFRQLESMQSLEQDRRLDAYRDSMTPWYDDQKSAFRLLIGPFGKVQALQLSTQLKNKQLDNFLYQLN